jgi:Tfp pilus assembly protein PilP
MTPIGGTIHAPLPRSLRRTDAELTLSAASSQEPARAKSAELGTAKPEVSASVAPPSAITLNPIGYVEKVGGKAEAIIAQENEVQVVHIGDLVAGRYRVTKITPDSVEAVDATQAQSAMAKPEPTDSLGFVQKADGKIEAVVTDGDTVRLVPQTSTTFLAQTAPPLDLSKGKPPEAGSAANAGTPSLVTGEVVAALPNPSPTASSVPPSVFWQASYPLPIDPVGPAEWSASYRMPFGGGKEPPGGSEPSNDPGESSGSVSVEEHPESDGFATSCGGGHGSISLTAVSLSEGPGDPCALTVEERLEPRGLGVPLLMKPIGFVIKADGKFAAILSQEDEVYVVREGDIFAGRYRALNVSPAAVEAVEELQGRLPPDPSPTPPAFPDLLLASTGEGSFPISCSSCSHDKPAVLSGEKLAVGPADSRPPPLSKRKHERRWVAPVKVPADSRPSSNSEPAPSLRAGQALIPQAREKGLAFRGNDDQGGVRVPSTGPATPPNPPTFVFQTLGYVETADGDRRAVVADGPQTYLVKEGETFANQYQATSVGSAVVIAIRTPPGQDVGKAADLETQVCATISLCGQTDSSTRTAFNQVDGHLNFSSLGVTGARFLSETGAPGGHGLAALGLDLFDSSWAGFNLQSQF